jgi:hypothetical protein
LQHIPPIERCGYEEDFTKKTSPLLLTLYCETTHDSDLMNCELSKHNSCVRYKAASSFVRVILVKEKNQSIKYKDILMGVSIMKCYLHGSSLVGELEIS